MGVFPLTLTVRILRDTMKITELQRTIDEIQIFSTLQKKCSSKMKAKLSVFDMTQFSKATKLDRQFGKKILVSMESIEQEVAMKTFAFDIKVAFIGYVR